MGARYFLLPGTPEWTSAVRGIASFLDETELVYPSPEVLYNRHSSERRESWRVRQDWHLRRNKAVYPRAWVVHSARLTRRPSTPKSHNRLIKNLTLHE